MITANDIVKANEVLKRGGTQPPDLIATYRKIQGDPLY